MSANNAARPSAGLTFLLDFGPLLTFFVAYKIGGVILGTFVFMVAILVALIVSWAKTGRVSPMTWISAVLVVGFGALTLYFGDPRFIQMKPTIIYAGFALLLFAGLAARKPLLKYVFGMAFEGLDEAGWMKLTLNWAIFFAAMAVLNELLRAWLSFDTWLTVKVWGIPAVSLLFAFANIPMLMRHGFSVSEAKDSSQAADAPPVPPQG